MKMKLSAIFILILSMSCPAYAVDQLAMEAALPQADTRSSSDFRGALVTGDDQLIMKAGQLFSDGGHFEGMQLPYLLSTPKPILYPRWALRQGWQGDVSIAIEILPSGEVGRTKVMKSTGHNLLDEAAVKAVHTWHFHPAMKNGKATVTCIQIPIRFQINSKS